MEAVFTRELLKDLPKNQTLSQLWISSAYTSLKGVGRLGGLIKASENRRAILGCNAQTEWRALQELQEAGVQVQLMPDPPGRIFHPKCLFAETHDGQAWVMAGSANLTEGGLRANIEAGIRVSGPRNLKVMNEARRFFSDLAEAAAPLTPELLARLRAVQDEIGEIMKRAAPGSMTELVGLDPAQALLLTRAGQQLSKDVEIQGFLNYIQETKMEASYKMVILPLLLQSDAGHLEMRELARRFLRFYQLLALSGRPTERPPMKMQHSAGMVLSRAVTVIKDAPRDAFSRTGLVEYGEDYVAISRQVWDRLDEGSRMAARDLAVGRLEGYYLTHLGFSEDFSSLLFAAELWA